MRNTQSCHLCGLEAGYLLPHKNPLIYGFSCRRCGDYYIDSFLVDLGEPTKDEDRAILSGFTRWEDELQKPTPEILNENYEDVIESNKNYSDKEKVDKILLYYSKKYPNKGEYPKFDFSLDYPVSYSKNSDEFIYLLQKVAAELFGFIKTESVDTFQILPEGWKRIDWLNRLELADEKYDIKSEKIMKEISSIELGLIAQANVKGSRYSSGLARKRRDLYLGGTIQKLEKKLEIDKEVILGLKIISKPADLNFLFGRIRKLEEIEKNFLNKSLREIYQDCKAPQSFFDHDIAEVYKEVDSKIKEILVDLQVEESKGKEAKIPELLDKDIDILIGMDEGSQLEFKSTFQWDIKQKQKKINLRSEVIKTIAAFNNTEGGYLIIGIDDNKKIFGLEKDYSLFKKQNKDVFLQTLIHEIENKISKDIATKINVNFYNLENKDVCRIKVNFGDEPIWVKESKNNEVFYIRLQNLTKTLSPSESMKYITRKWGKI